MFLTMSKHNYFFNNMHVLKQCIKDYFANIYSHVDRSVSLWIVGVLCPGYNGCSLPPHTPQVVGCPKGLTHPR